MTVLSQSAADAVNDQNIALVDATWILPGSETDLEEFLRGTAHCVDCDAIKAVPVSERLSAAKRAFGSAGMDGSSTYAVYDRARLFSAPWIWWMLRSFGVAARLVEGWSDDTVVSEPSQKESVFQGSIDPSLSNATRDQVLAALGTQAQIIDARPPGRFSGEAPEPRAECRSGHIPGSLNVPFGTLKSEDVPRSFKPKEVLADQFNLAGVDLSKPIVTTCGSGVTASGLAFCLIRAGAENVQVYQGSWAEWGVDPSLPIETGS